MNNNNLTQRQENFTRLIFQGMSQYDAYKAAGYSITARATIDNNASRLANNDKIKARLAELNKSADDPLIMKERERRIVLSEVGRGDLTDFISEDGVPKLTKETPNRRAAAEFYIRHSFNKQGDPVVTKSIRLHNPMTGIDYLNKMDRIYDDKTPPGTTIYNSFMFVLPDGTRVSPKQLREVDAVEVKGVVT